MAARKKTKKETASEKTGAGNRQVVPLLPLRDIVVFPYMVVPFFVGREKSISALETAMRDKTDILLCAQKTSTTHHPGFEDIFPIGCLATIIQLVKLPDGTLKVLVEGRKRARIVQSISDKNYLLVEAEEMNENPEDEVTAQALMRTLKQSFEGYVKLNKRIPPEMLMNIQGIDDASRLADTVTAHLNLRLEDKQELQEIAEPVKRMEKLMSLLEGEMEILQVERRIRNRVKKQMEKGQREYYLNEQMAAIQKELGERDEFKLEVEAIEKAIKEAGMSAEAVEKAKAELRKLKNMTPMSPEATVIRNYLDVLTTIPWKQQTTDNLDLAHAEAVLSNEHYGLDKIKERIVEYLAVQNLTKEIKGPILCFLGPPGVGKTSLGQSIANAIERKFVRIALGGLHDEAEIRGHRRTYIGAMPGKIVQAMKKAGAKNPLILLDEIDKMGADFRGDPGAAMLEVLDPEQNKSFTDHYLEVEYDLSKVMFIATANSLSGIPQPLLDRMELIELSSYMETEKIHIAQKHLVPKQLKHNGLSEKEVKMEREAVMEIIRHYTREAGVRSLEREIGKVARKTARKAVEAGKKKKAFTITAKDVEQMLGPHKYRYGSIEKTDLVGICTGLAWTEVGGELLQIEVSIVPGRGKLTITGKLGDVMQESAQAAYSYVRAKAPELSLPKDFYNRIDIHIHVPEGATPKDGPSAGITMATALSSALTNRPVRKDVAMTGEITLRGNVLEIGGLKEKLLAAHRAGIKTVLIPADNEKDLYDVPKEILKDLRIVPVAHVDEVLLEALLLKPSDPILKLLKERKDRAPIPPAPVDGSGVPGAPAAH